MRVITFLLLLCVQVTAAAKTFYLSPNGSINGDGSIENPYPGFKETLSAGLIEWQKATLPFNFSGPNNYTTINAGAPIKGGDTLKLLDGYYGDISYRNVSFDEPLIIQSDSVHGSVFGTVHLMGGANWTFDGIKVDYSQSSEPSPSGGAIVHVETHSWQGLAHNIVIKNSLITNTNDISGFDADDWNELIIGVKTSAENIELNNNEIVNVSFGISASGNHTVATENTIHNFTGDGIRGLGNDSEYAHNVIYNGIDVSDNHDDCFQSWATGGQPVHNVVVANNICLADYNHPAPTFLSKFQGIGLFDGPYENITITDNYVSTSTWEGITIMGVSNSVVIGNVVIDSDTDDSLYPWIRITASKSGSSGDGNEIKLNVGEVITGASGVVYSKNYEVE